VIDWVEVIGYKNYVIEGKKKKILKYKSRCMEKRMKVIEGKIVWKLLYGSY